MSIKELLKGREVDDAFERGDLFCDSRRAVSSRVNRAT